ncbi:MAG TPA: deoxyribodipyrimidine photolyase [Kofleriaceae bacterium]|nr:deoxyribodipyrimidine photolyase [Kofleriaceae bacterium]
MTRVTAGNDRPIARGRYVLYWMIAARRARWSFALDHAIARARELGVPLVVLEALRAGYAHASDRLHRFVIDGMDDNARAFDAAGVTYHAYVERAAGEGGGLLEALAARASVVVTDEWPGFFVPRMVAAAAAKLRVRLELVDGNGLLPLRMHGRAFDSAIAFRRHWQRVIAPALAERPNAAPLEVLPRALRGGEIAGSILRRWPRAGAIDLATLPIDHEVAPVRDRGGARAAAAALDHFIGDQLARYHEDRAQPGTGSGLSPYLHFGHVGAHEIIARVWDHAGWDPSRVSQRAHGRREGWWGLPRAHETFMDQIVTWRELGFGFAFHVRDHTSWRSLPAWARASLDQHASDPRTFRYSRDQLARAQTHDPIWNAAQTQLRRDGRIDNYLRMLWGKKILEWSASPRAALANLIALNDRYAVDGRDPNSYNGICWTLGRFDRPWPERAIYGVIRSMSSERTAKKLDLREYMKTYAPGASLSSWPSSASRTTRRSSSRSR